MIQYMQHGETVHSALPWDIPWWMSDHFVFFGVLYLVLLIVGSGVGWVVLQSLLQLKGGHGAEHH